MRNGNGRKKLPVTLTEAEIEALRSRCTRPATGLRNRALFELMLSAGLRVSEAVSLKQNAIDWQAGTIRINDGKGGKDRIVPVDHTTLAHLQTWASKRSELGFSARQPFLIGIRTGKGMTTRNAFAIVSKQAKLAGIEKTVGPHTLRHTYASRLLDRGFTIREVQELLGHADVSTTMVYTHVNPSALREKIQKRTEDPQAKAMAEFLISLTAEQRQTLQDLLKTGAEKR
jgi:integrase/recombinase XerD